MLIFNSKLDNSISGTEDNINCAIESIKKCQELKPSLPEITESNIIQALMDSGSPTTQDATSIRTTIERWPAGKAPGKATWCSKRGLYFDSGLSELALAFKEGRITYEEYNLILLSKVWISDEKNTPAIFTNALKVLSLVDNTTESISEAVVTAYNRIVGGSYTRSDFHPAELSQFCSIVSSAGFKTSRTGSTIKSIIRQWGCNFDLIKKPKYGSGEFPDFHLTNDVYSYMGNMSNGIFEAIFDNPVSFNEMFPNIHPKKSNNNMIQKIYYGAPGTGKSNEIKILTGKGKDGIMFSKNLTFRTTFHPDTDYSSFVGAYKPIWNKDIGKIIYEFRPQTFLKAYVAAWTHPSENVALVIEEINRGNCAQIFGDIFQLLDREKNGLSKYPIESDIDMKDFLSRALSGEIKEPWAGEINEDEMDEINDYYSNHYDDAFAKIKSGEILALPKNLSILATMNTSDQSLFPMDSAFKRRWEWQYMPIVNAEKNWKVKLHEDYLNIDWWEFLQRINRVISDLTTSEDKQLGYFFCQPDDFVNPDDVEPDLITAKRFVDKVIFYLWNDVFKDYAFDADCCKDSNKKEVLFAKFYNEDGKSVNIETLKHFFESLTVENESPLVEKVPSADASSEEEASTNDASSVDEEPSQTDNESEIAESSTPATTDE